jgi:uncharacterized protein YkwD
MGSPPAHRYGAGASINDHLASQGNRSMAQPPAELRVTSHFRRAATLLLSIGVAAAALTSAAPVRAAGGDGLRAEANSYRVAGGLNPVVGTPLLDDIATHRAAQMVAAGSMEHNIDYVFDRLQDAGVCWKGVGEIIALNWSSPFDYSATVQQWWTSKDHHDIIMTAAYNAAGGAWQTASDGANYSVMVFVELCGDAITSAGVHVLWPDTRYDPARRMVFHEGRFTGYKLSRSGAVLGKKTVHFGSRHRNTSAGWAQVDDHVWLKVSSGPLAGFWVHETPDSFVRGRTWHKAYDPQQWVLVKAGRYTGFQFTWLGEVEREKALRTTIRVKMRTNVRAIINGRTYFRISSGSLDGYWLRDTDKVSLK